MFDAHCHIGEYTSSALVCTSSLEEYPYLSAYPHRGYGLLFPERDESSRIIESLERDRKALCGEIGLDRRYVKAADIQFLENLLDYLCQDERPFVLHLVRRMDEMLSLLRRQKRLPHFLIHGYTGSYESARQFVALGGVISIGPRSFRTRDIDRLLHLPFVLETDMKVSPEQEMTLERVYEEARMRLGISFSSLDEMTERNLEMLNIEQNRSL